MKYRVGKRIVGEVPNETVANYKPKSHDWDKINEVIIEAIARLIKANKHKPGARQAFSKALKNGGGK